MEGEFGSVCKTRIAEENGDEELIEGMAGVGEGMEMKGMKTGFGANGLDAAEMAVPFAEEGNLVVGEGESDGPVR
jgi:hypothetical protein